MIKEESRFKASTVFEGMTSIRALIDNLKADVKNARKIDKILFDNSKSKSKFKEIDFEQAKKDVLPFINNSSKLNVWGLEYFNYLVEQLMDNTITVFFRSFDLSEYGKNKILSEEIIDNISFSSKNHKNNIWKELKIKFNRYIVLDSEVFSFGNKTEKLDSYYVIEDFGEILYLKKNVDIEKVLSILKS